MRCIELHNGKTSAVGLFWGKYAENNLCLLFWEAAAECEAGAPLNRCTGFA